MSGARWSKPSVIEVDSETSDTIVTMIGEQKGLTEIARATGLTVASVQYRVGALARAGRIKPKVRPYYKRTT